MKIVKIYKLKLRLLKPIENKNKIKFDPKKIYHFAFWNQMTKLPLQMGILGYALLI